LKADTYAHFLAGVFQKDDRELCLTLGYEHGLPMAECRRLIVKKILERCVNSAEESDSDEQVDEIRVAAVDWLLMEPLQELDALRLGNSVVRFFVAEHKPELAGRTLEKIAAAVDPAAAGSPEEMANWLKEYESLVVYVTAKERFSEWFSFYHKAKPVEPEAPDLGGVQGRGEGRQYVDMVAHERQTARYREELERWTNSLQVQSAAVVEALEGVLHFPGGWLDCVGQNDDPAGARAREVDYLRRTCVVEVCLLLHTVLHKTHQYERATRVSDAVADERYALYSLFSREDMRRLLDAVRGSFLCLMEAGNGDPWAGRSASAAAATATSKGKKGQRKK